MTDQTRSCATLEDFLTIIPASVPVQLHTLPGICADSAVKVYTVVLALTATHADVQVTWRWLVGAWEEFLNGEPFGVNDRPMIETHVARVRADLLTLLAAQGRQVTQHRGEWSPCDAAEVTQQSGTKALLDLHHYDPLRPPQMMDIGQYRGRMDGV